MKRLLLSALVVFTLVVLFAAALMPLDAQQHNPPPCAIVYACYQAPCPCVPTATPRAVLTFEPEAVNIPPSLYTALAQFARRFGR